jgi:hypothetical protein
VRFLSRGGCAPVAARRLPARLPGLPELGTAHQSAVSTRARCRWVRRTLPLVPSSAARANSATANSIACVLPFRRQLNFLTMGQIFGNPNYVRYRSSMFLDVLYAEAESNPAATVIACLDPVLFQPINDLRTLVGPHL